MARLPPLPQLDWPDPDHADAPHATDLGDVYFSGDGLSEKRVVFLAGCGLPEAFAGRDLFVIGELGFGTGLTFLAAWDLWRRFRPHPDARLVFVSCEAAPMSAADAARAHRLWPELADLSAQLLQRWPVRAAGVQRIAFGDGVSLILHIGDAAACLADMDARIDAWFLDGFAPAKNPAMWTPEIFAHIARLSAPGARAATYTVAGDVRRGLEAVGFGVAKVPGHGRKKERLEARMPAVARTPDQPPRSILIIGAGIAGATAARAVLDRGARAIVLDAGGAPGAGASGNPLALVMPRLDAADGPAARGLIEAWLLARRVYRALGPEAVQTLDVRHLPRGEAERARFARLLADPPLDADILASLDPNDPSAGLLHRGALAIRPDAALPALLADADLRVDSRVISIRDTPDAAAAQLTTGEEIAADAVIVCAAMGARAIAGLAAPDLAARLGQIETAPLDVPRAAVADGGYVVSAHGRLVFGATFEAAPDGPPAITDAARAANLAVLARLRPDIDPAALSLASRAAIRAATPDRLPFAGAPPVLSTNEKAPAEQPAPSGRVRLIGGLGSRGYLWAPLLAELVVSSLFGEPAPAERSVVAALDPDRFRRRALRKRT
jgi:tRNA 5-methylaminomethyl-2-thiouridine biosynthesis bifunctional protein